MANQTNSITNIIKRDIQYGNNKIGFTRINRRQICDLIIATLNKVIDENHEFYTYLKKVLDYTFKCHEIGDIILSPGDYDEEICNFRAKYRIRRFREREDNNNEYDEVLKAVLKMVLEYTELCFDCSIRQVDWYCLKCEKKMKHSYYPKHCHTKLHKKNAGEEEEDELTIRIMNLRDF
jgi:hypothetical protein